MLNRIEIRVNNISNALKYSNYEINEIGIGNEGCLLKIPSFEQIEGIVNATDKQVKLVLPFVPQNHIIKVKNLLNEIVKRKLKMSLVINDLGVLSYLQTLDISNLTIMIGRFLDWSYSLIPWGENILRNENSEVLQYAMQSSLFDNKKLKLFKNMGVKGIELNATKKNMELSSSFDNCDLHTYLHYGYSILATSRACAYRRMKHSFECISDCDISSEVMMKAKWIPSCSFAENNDNFTEDEEIKRTFPKLYLKNNMVFRKNEISLNSLLENESINIIINEELIKNKEWFEWTLKGGELD